jgi:hypothetical protein
MPNEATAPKPILPANAQNWPGAKKESDENMAPAYCNALH